MHLSYDLRRVAVVVGLLFTVVASLFAAHVASSSPAQAATFSFCNHTGRSMKYQSGSGSSGTLLHNQCRAVSGLAYAVPQVNGYWRGSNGTIGSYSANRWVGINGTGGVVYRFYAS